MTKNSTQIDDLQAEGNLKRINDLEVFRKEFEGTEFYAKVANAIKESRLVEAEVKRVAWGMVREKIVWILLGGIGIVLTDLVIRAVPHILSFI